MELFLHESATFREADADTPAVIRDYLESPIVDPEDQPAFDVAFRAAREHAPGTVGRLLAHRYRAAVYGDGGCLAWLLTVTGTKMLAIVAIHAGVNAGGSRAAVVPWVCWGLVSLAAGVFLTRRERNSNRQACAAFVETIAPLSEQDPSALVETLPLLTRVAADPRASEETRTRAGVAAARVRSSLRSELPVVSGEPAPDTAALPYSLGLSA